MEDLRYPIGKFVPKEEYTDLEIKEFIDTLAGFPSALAEICKQMEDESQLELTYRPDGWSIRQVVHHLADSHANMYIRVKNALTTDNPTVAGYSEKEWANTPDNQIDIQVSIALIQGLHTRLVAHLKGLDIPFYKNRTFFHAGYERTYTIGAVLGLYSWHGKHHIEHIKLALNTK
ncbi:MAG: YfiT family bacillithiol transferase [Spirosomataceae bacterium]